MQKDTYSSDLLKEWGFLNVEYSMLNDADKSRLLDILREDDIIRICCPEKYNACFDKQSETDDVREAEPTNVQEYASQQQVGSSCCSCEEQVKDFINSITREDVSELKLFELVLEYANDNGCVFLTTLLAKMHGFFVELFNKKLATMNERRLLIQSRNDRNQFRRTILSVAVRSLAAKGIAQYTSKSGEIVINRELWQMFLFSERIDYIVLCRQKCESLIMEGKGMP